MFQNAEGAILNQSINKYIPALVESAMVNDKRGIRMATVAIIKRMSQDSDKSTLNLVDKLQNLLGDFEIGKLGARSNSTSSSLFINRVPSNEQQLVLNRDEYQRISEFVKGMKNADILLQNGVPPANSLLLYGKPGVGKTSIATTIATSLDLPLMSVNLAELISSYLGRTGKNISKIIEQAKQQPSVLFFDEFDAVAAERNSDNDVAELRRIVNVLLMELDQWPSDSVIIAATNHPEMLDSAVWRRFRSTIEIQMPDKAERIKLWSQYAETSNIVPADNFVNSALADIVLSPADIRNISFAALQHCLIDGIPIELSLTRALVDSKATLSKDSKLLIIKSLSDKPLSFSQREIATALKITHTTVGRYLRGANSDE